MTTRVIIAGLLSCLACGSVAATDAPVAQAANLQVLPQRTSLVDVTELMLRFQRDLGVQCSHCHVASDYASDENPRKQTARLMMSMLNDINGKYLAQLGDRRYAIPITCGNCHQGQTSPPQFGAE
jgi:hypothetical protein